MPMYDDPAVPDSETLYRRVPPKPEWLTTDPVTGLIVPHAAALQRRTGEGLSVHLDSVLNNLGRDPHTLYDPECPSFAFLASVPRSQGDGVIPVRVGPPDEPDSDRGQAHAEVRAPEQADTPTHWRRVRTAIIKDMWWVTTPEEVGLAPVEH